MTQDTETIDPAITPHRMTIDWDVPIAMDDGIVLRADVFRPATAGEYPVLLSYGPYAKGLPFQVGYPSAWEKMVGDHPDVEHGSSSAHQNWEVVDPEQWVRLHPAHRGVLASSRNRLDHTVSRRQHGNLDA
jgi:predicted acyl esterase